MLYIFIALHLAIMWVNIIYCLKSIWLFFWTIGEWITCMISSPFFATFVAELAAAFAYYVITSLYQLHNLITLDTMPKIIIILNLSHLNIPFFTFIFSMYWHKTSTTISISTFFTYYLIIACLYTYFTIFNLFWLIIDLLCKI